MSSRVMEALNYFSPEVEIYSIDEAFLKLTPNAQDKLNNFDLIDKGQDIKRKIYKWVGLPVSIGIAPNKTLAKIANKVAKKSRLGVFDIRDEKIRLEVLAETPINDLWGIGYSSNQKLKKLGINTALQLKELDRRWARKLLTVVGARIVEELNGETCLPLELTPPPKKSITCSRSFGAMVESLEVLQEALDFYLVSAGEKMRKHKLSANAVTVFLSTNRFAKTLQYSNSITIELANATNSTRELREWTKKALTRIYKEGYFYKKVGVILLGLQPESSETIRLYNQPSYEKDKRLMMALDKISNKFGRNTVTLGFRKSEKCWQMKSERKSKRFTTCFKELWQIPSALPD